jgi:predicted GNAT superfamily acetyltransferase
VTGTRVTARANQKWRPLALNALLAGGAFLVNEAIMDSEGLPSPPLNYISQPSNLMLVEVPVDFQAIKRRDMALARRWRSHTRDVFEAMFHSGFMVTDFVLQEDVGGRQRAYYLLTHQDS